MTVNVYLSLLLVCFSFAILKTYLKMIYVIHHIYTVYTYSISKSAIVLMAIQNEFKPTRFQTQVM